MKYKIAGILILLCVVGYLKAQNLNAILPTGNWNVNSRIDSIHKGDTLVLTYSADPKEFQMKFTDDGKVSWYIKRMDDDLNIDGSRDMKYVHAWELIGNWKANEKDIVIFIDMLPANYTELASGKNIVCSEIGKAKNGVVKLKVRSIDIVK